MSVCPECGLSREVWVEMGGGEIGYICETGCIQYDDPPAEILPLDPLPWIHAGSDDLIANRFQHSPSPWSAFSPRPGYAQDEALYASQTG